MSFRAPTRNLLTYLLTYLLTKKSQNNLRGPLEQTLLQRDAHHQHMKTQPGMMLLPGSFSGRKSSPRPLRGPEPRRRRSLAIFIRLHATVLRAPLTCTRASLHASASNLLGAVTNGNPTLHINRESKAKFFPKQHGHYITLETIYSGISKSNCKVHYGDAVIKQCLGKIAEINEFSAFDEML